MIGKNMIGKNAKCKLCSREQMEKILGKIILLNLTFMDAPTSGRLIEVNDEYFVIETRDGRSMVARLDSIIGFSVVKKQYPQAI